MPVYYLIAPLTFTPALHHAYLQIWKLRHRETAGEEPLWDSCHKALLPVGAAIMFPHSPPCPPGSTEHAKVHDVEFRSWPRR